MIKRQTKPKAVFFDAGNTLFHFNTALLQKELAPLDIVIDASQFDDANKKACAYLNTLSKTIESWEERYHKSHLFWFEQAGIKTTDQKKVLEILSTHPQRHLFWSRVFPETRKILQTLKQKGLKLGIISNAEGQVQNVVDRVGFADLFKTVIDSHVVKAAKPDPKIFKIALERIGVAAEEAWHVGDLYEIDVVGARRAGLTPILYDIHGLYPEADCRRITHLSALLDTQDPE